MSVGRQPGPAPAASTRAYGTDPTPPSTEAKRAFRLLRADLDTRAKTLIQAADRVPVDLLKSVRFKTARGRDAAMREILRRMPAPPLNTEKRSGIWRLLAIERDMIEVQGLGFDASTTGWVRRSFGLTFSSHSLLRFFDRSGFCEDAEQAMLRAHSALLSLSPNEGNELFGLRSISLPGGKGLFLCASQNRTDKSDFPHAVASTWIAEQQLRPDQETHQLAWNTLMSPEA